MGVGDSRRRSRPAWRRRVATAALVVVALLVAACTGGNDDAENAEPDASTSDSLEPADTPSTTAPAETTTSTPPGPPVPEDAPEIINTGDDFEAMYRSFNEFINWLAMNPDPDLVDVVYSPRGPQYEIQKEAVGAMALLRNHAQGRWQEIDAVELKGLRDGPGGSPLFDMIVTHRFPSAQILDANGKVVRDREPSTDRYLITLLTDDGRWRIGDTVELI